MKKIFILSSLIAVTLATPSFAEPTELDKKTVASKAYVDTKQDIIETGLVTIHEPEVNVDYTIPTLVSYGTGTNNADGLRGDKIGVAGLTTINWSFLAFDMDPWDSSEAVYDNYVPTVRAVSGMLQNLNDNLQWHPLPWSNTQSAAINAYNTEFGNGTNQWAGTSTYLINGGFLANSLALKQNKLSAKSTGNAAPKGNQAVVLNSAGNPSNVYTTAGKDLALTAKSGAQKVMNYIDGTTASATFAASQGFTEAKVKSALVSLELLKDVYGELNAKITNNALPTGTTGTVVTYNGVNAETGVQQFTETAISGTATYDDNDQLTNGNNIANVSLVETEIATRQKKRTCAGYEPGHENEADYCWLWNFPD